MNKLFIPLLMVLAAGFVLWHLKTSLMPVAPVGDHVPAKVAPQVKDVPKVEITPAKIKVYAPKAKKRLKLPDAVHENQNIHVVESTRVQADDHPQTITTVINAETGETETLVRREPLPWLAFKKSGALGLDYDVLRGSRTLYVRQDFVQIKAFYASGIAAISDDRSKLLGFKLEYRW